MANSFNPHQLRKAGFTHIKDKDFSDDGTRFSIWEKDGVSFSYAKNDGQVYLSGRFDYDGVPFDTYRFFPSYALCDAYNGVDEDSIDLDKLIANAKEMAKDLADFKAGKKVFEDDVNKMTKDELRDFLAKKHYTGRNKSGKVFQLAWEYGHANGHLEVESFYIDLAELAR